MLSRYLIFLHIDSAAVLIYCGEPGYYFQPPSGFHPGLRASFQSEQEYLQLNSLIFREAPLLYLLIIASRPLLWLSDYLYHFLFY